MLSLMVISISTTWANDEKYIQQMTKNIDSVYNAQTMDQFLQSANAFDRIASAEKTKWEPFYYSAFAYVMLANKESETARKDLFLDMAKASIEKAIQIKFDESEIVALEGFIYMIRVTVDPAARGQQYSGMAMQAFGKAIGLNAENPRAWALMARMQYGTAQFFNAGTAEACATTKVAMEKFLTYKSDNPLAPVWGKDMTESLKSKCQ